MDASPFLRCAANLLEFSFRPDCSPCVFETFSQVAELWENKFCECTFENDKMNEHYEKLESPDVNKMIFDYHT